MLVAFVAACDECVAVCASMIEDEFEDFDNDKHVPTDDTDINLLKPREIKAVLDDFVRELVSAFGISMIRV